MKMDYFTRLAPFIQEFIYSSGWTEFRAVQLAACEVLFSCDSNLLLSADTASGKTEAAFLPVITLINENPPASVGVLYISPLKALINDQFSRLDFLLSEAGIPVYKWHSDSSPSMKKRLLDDPKGILQITPESLESMIIGRRSDLGRLFGGLKYIVIDEVHYFMGSLRGMQLLCQLERLQKITGCSPIRIGLSASLNDCGSAEKWLNSGSVRNCITPLVHAPKKKLGIAMECFFADDDTFGSVPDQAEYIYSRTLGRKSIIFANSRSEAEYIISCLKKISSQRGTKDVYRVHHGSISKSLREQTENDLKHSEDPLVAAATVTLELGIDIGSLDRVVQLGSPHSASSFVQRIGRCARRGQRANLIFSFEDRPGSSEPGSLHSINWEFLKAIAVLELYIEEKWVEPVTQPACPYSLVYQQTLSYLLTEGEQSAPLLAQNILTMSAFSRISQQDYRLLLRHLLEIGHIQRTEKGGLIIGPNAEKIISDYRFYSVFETGEEYNVSYESQIIGTVTELYPPGSIFSLAAKTWEAVVSDRKTKTIFVKESSGYSKAGWVSASEYEVHSVIVRKIREIISSGETYKYLSPNCVKLLEKIRKTAQENNIPQAALVPLGGSIFAFFPWTGTKQLNTLLLILQSRGISCGTGRTRHVPVYIGIKYEGRPENLKKMLEDIAEEETNPENFILSGVSISGKYNEYIPEELLKKQFIEDYTDIGGLKNDMLYYK